jgi:large subunit ribosomal protein L27
MAHKKAGGSTSNVRDSKSKRLGVKLFGGQRVNAGGIVIRQKGTKFRAGRNSYTGKDKTIHAKITGIVSFSQKQCTKFNGRKEKCTLVHVQPVSAQ